MGIAVLSSMRSKDPNTQVGACVVNQENKIVSLGYNGLPDQLDDNSFNWSNTKTDYINSKYFAVIHAEQNAFLNCFTELKDCILYVTNFPCSACAKEIAQYKIQKIYYLNDKYAQEEDYLAAKKLLTMCKIKFQQLTDFKLKIST